MFISSLNVFLFFLSLFSPSFLLSYFLPTFFTPIPTMPLSIILASDEEEPTSAGKDYFYFIFLNAHFVSNCQDFISKILFHLYLFLVPLCFTIIHEIGYIVLNKIVDIKLSHSWTLKKEIKRKEKKNLKKPN